MKTTIDIPKSTLEEAMKFTGAKTTREIVNAVEDFNRRNRLAALAKRLHGSMPNFMTQEDLKTMREDDKWEPAE